MTTKCPPKDAIKILCALELLLATGLTAETSFESLSEFELFKSTETKIYFTESIVNKCTVKLIFLKL